MCGCIEDMPEVSRADCSVPGDGDNFDACTNNDLRTRFKEVYPDDMLDNLVGECDDEESNSGSTSGGSSSGSSGGDAQPTPAPSTPAPVDDQSTSGGSSSGGSSATDSETYSDVADFNFDSCDYNTYMCCWTENNNQGMEDNTVRLAAFALCL